MDLILGPFSDAALVQLSATEIDAYEVLLRENDLDLYAWYSGTGPSPAEHTAIFQVLRAFHTAR